MSNGDNGNSGSVIFASAVSAVKRVLA